MKVAKLVIENFRRYESVEFSFRELNIIRARNRKGKTSIAEAIVWCVYGQDLRGKLRSEKRLLRQGATVMTVAVTLVADDGTQYDVVRSYGDKDAAQTVNGRKVSKERIEELFGSPNEFLSVFWPGFFSRLDPKDGRALLAKLLPPVDHEEVIKVLMPQDAALMKSVTFAMGLDSVEVFLQKERMKLAEAEREEAKLEGEIRAHKDTLSDDFPVEPEPLSPTSAERYEAAKKEIAELEAGLGTTTPKTERLTSLQEQKNSIITEHTMLKGQLVTISDDCPTCHQHLSDEIKAAVHADLTKRNLEVRRKMADVNRRANQLKADIEATEALPDTSDQLATLKELREKVEKFDKLIEAQTQKETEYRTKLEGVEKARERLEFAESDLVVQQKAVAQLKDTIKAAVNYRVKYTEIQVEKINALFKMVNIELFDVTKQGEVKPTFSVTWDKIPYLSLSTSETVRCDLEIGYVISKLRGETLPVFVDNAELTQDLLREQFAGQVFAVYVTKFDEVKVRTFAGKRAS